MTLEPLLNIYLQAGLSALKTPYPNFSDLFAGVFLSHLTSPPTPSPHTLFMCKVGCLQSFDRDDRAVGNNKSLGRP
uniref:Protein CLP1 homolog n=1 Tax=Rhizophora mucronata TaxID=61149 RepID=A0A2P2JLR7_RHIMU